MDRSAPAEKEGALEKPPSAPAEFAQSTRAHAGTMSFFLRAPCLQSIKQTTGIVGLEVIPNSRGVLRGLVQRVLSDVRAHIPEEAGYRKVVEATYASRLDVIDANEDPAAIEAKIGSGQIEELVAQAKDELGLIPKMKEWKPWEFSHTIRMEDESKQPSEDK